MRGVFRLFVAAMLLAGWSLAALSVHVVQTRGGFRLVTKNELGVADTFVDARQWSRADEGTHRTLYERLRQLEKTSMLDAPAGEPDRDVVTKATPTKEAWERLSREAASLRR